MTKQTREVHLTQPVRLNKYQWELIIASLQESIREEYPEDEETVHNLIEEIEYQRGNRSGRSPTEEYLLNNPSPPANINRDRTNWDPKNGE